MYCRRNWVKGGGGKQKEYTTVLDTLAAETLSPGAAAVQLNKWKFCRHSFRRQLEAWAQACNMPGFKSCSSAYGACNIGYITSLLKPQFAQL